MSGRFLGTGGRQTRARHRSQTGRPVQGISIDSEIGEKYECGCGSGLICVALREMTDIVLVYELLQSSLVAFEVHWGRHGADYRNAEEENCWVWNMGLLNRARNSSSPNPRQPYWRLLY